MIETLDATTQTQSFDEGVFTQVWGSCGERHYQQGYEEGYQRAISDLLTAALVGTEEFLRFQAPQPQCDARQLLYRFNRFLESRLATRSADREFVSDGLGI